MFSKMPDKELQELASDITTMSLSRMLSPVLLQLGISANAEICKRVYDRIKASAPNK